MAREIAPDNPNHKSLEDDVAKFVEELGGITAKAGYHDVYPQEMKRLLQMNYGTTALYIRGRADRLALLPAGQCFVWEAKSHTSPKYSDITVEALPLAHHVASARLGVECLYCHRSLFDGRTDTGFWIATMPPIRQILIPKHMRGGSVETPAVLMEFFRDIFSFTWPDVRIWEPELVAGSGDPLAIIDSSEKDNLSDWRALIREAA